MALGGTDRVYDFETASASGSIAQRFAGGFSVASADWIIFGIGDPPLAAANVVAGSPNRVVDGSRKEFRPLIGRLGEPVSLRAICSLQCAQLPNSWIFSVLCGPRRFGIRAQADSEVLSSGSRRLFN